eukprot:m.1294448 g.1294448  ORF g.1294448 m.1294448 type:complete len:1420 (+) comp24788_c0_seq3:406-4665(+)
MDRDQILSHSWNGLLEAIKEIGVKRPGIMKRQMLLIHHDDRDDSSQTHLKSSCGDVAPEAHDENSNILHGKSVASTGREMWSCASELADNLALDFAKIGMTVNKIHAGTEQVQPGASKECDEPQDSAQLFTVPTTCHVALGDLYSPSTSGAGSETTTAVATAAMSQTHTPSSVPSSASAANAVDSPESCDNVIFLRNEKNDEISDTESLIDTAEVVVIVGSFGMGDTFAVRSDPRTSNLIDQALEHARKGHVQLVLVLAQGTYSTAFPKALHNWYTHDFRKRADYHLCMLCNEVGSDEVPGVLMAITELSGESLFEKHYSKFLLRSLTRRLPDRNADFVPRGMLTRLRSLLNDNPVVTLMSTTHCRALEPDTGDATAVTPAPIAPTCAVGAMCNGGVCTGSSTEAAIPVDTAVGKTAIAIEYAWASLEKKSYGVARWFDGSTGSLELQFRALASELHLVSVAASGTYGEVVAAVYKRLESLPVSYLFVFDDVFSHECIRHVLPPRGTAATANVPVAGGTETPTRRRKPAVLHHVLVTSSAHPATLQRESMSHQCFVDVPPLSRDETDLWLRAELPMIDDEDIVQLHNVVGGLAGGVALLVAQLWESNKEVEDVLDGMATIGASQASGSSAAGGNEHSVLESEGAHAGQADADCGHAHSALMRLCLDDVLTANPLAAQISAVLAYCNHPVVPFWILQQLVTRGVFHESRQQGTDGDAARSAVARTVAALQVLKGYRVCRCSNATITERRMCADDSSSDDLIRFNVFSYQCCRQADALNSDVSVWQHRIAPLLRGLTGIVRDASERVPFAGGVAVRKTAAATELLAACLGHVLGTIPNVATVSARADGNTGRVFVAACTAVGHALLHLHQPHRAFSFLRLAVDAHTLHMAGTAVADVRAGHLLGTIFDALGDHHSAVAVLETVNARTPHAHPSHAATVAARQLDLARALGGAGRLRDQAATLRSAMGTLQQLHGHTHFSLLPALQSLATLHGQLGQAEKRYECLKTTLDVYRQSYLHRSSGVCTTLVALGMTAGNLGLYRESVGYLTQALKLLESQDDHQETARVVQLLGNAYGATGDYAKSKELLQRCLSLQVKHLGRTHADVSITMISLGNTYGNLGDSGRKSQLLVQALATLRRTLPPQHPDIARAMTDLANAYIALGDVEHAISLLKSSIAIKREVFGDNHVETSKSLASLGVCWIHTGELRQARILLEQALATKIRHYGDGHIESANVLFSLSQLCRAEHNVQGQINHLAQVLQVKRAALGNDHADVAYVLEELASAYLDSGSHIEKALDLLRESLTILEAVFGLDSAHLAGVLRLLSKALVGAKHYREKLSVLQRLLHLDDPSVDLISRTQTLANVGLLHWAMGNRKDAVVTMSEAANTLKNSPGSAAESDSQQLFGAVRAYLARMMEQNVTSQI